MLESAAPWITIAAAVLAVAVIAVLGLRTWRDWRRVRLTQEAASALLDVHQERLDVALDRLGSRSGDLADQGEELADAMGELRADAAHLRWLLARVPDERARLQRELGELLLPGTRDDG